MAKRPIHLHKHTIRVPSVFMLSLYLIVLGVMNPILVIRFSVHTILSSVSYLRGGKLAHAKALPSDRKSVV